MADAKQEALKAQQMKELTTKKFELVSKIKDIQAELAKVNQELLRNGADTAVVICW